MEVFFKKKNQFFSDINIFDKPKFYISGAIKTTLPIKNTSAGKLTQVIPYGGMQWTWSKDQKSEYQIINGTNTYTNLKISDNMDIRIQPLNGILTSESKTPGGDWDPQLRSLLTVYQQPLIVNLEGMPVRVGNAKLQGDIQGGINSGISLGGRGVVETYRGENDWFPYSIELAGGMKAKLKMPQILSND